MGDELEEGEAPPVAPMASAGVPMAAEAGESPAPMPPKEPAAAEAAGEIVLEGAEETGCTAGQMGAEEVVGVAEMAPVPASEEIPTGTGAKGAAPAPTHPRVPVAAGPETGPPGGGRWK